MSEVWDDALWALRALAADPAGLGGIWLRAGHGPVRETWLHKLRQTGRPLIKVPATVDDTALLGGTDLTQSLQDGTLRWKSGLLAHAHQGVIQLPMAERFPKDLLARLAQAMDQRQVVESRGSVAAAEFGVVALDESDDEDTRLHPAMADRLGIWLDVRALSLHDVDQALDEPSPSMRPVSAAQLSGAQLSGAQLSGAQQGPRLQDDQLEALCALALSLGIDSPRAVLFASRLASVSAGMEGRTTVEQADLVRATRCVLLPRATRWPVSQADEAAQAQPPEPPPADPTESESESESEPQPPDDSSSASPPEDVQALEDVLLAATVASLPEHLLDSLMTRQPPRSRAGAAGHSGRLQQSGQRGRPLPSRPGSPHDRGRLDLLATLRHAAPRQRLRASAPHAPPGALKLRGQDFHVQRHEQRSTTCLILALDASGSAAMHRLAQAKGAVELLLAQSYARRDSVCVVAFRGTQAQCLLPPTRSLVRAKRALAGLPGGGGTPLASALQVCVDQALKLRRDGATAHLVVLSDGRANVTLQGMGGRAQAHADAQRLAQQWASLGMESLWIDTALQPEPVAQSLASTMGARYLPMPHVQAQRLAHAMQIQPPLRAP